MFCVTLGQRSKTADVVTQVVTSWTWLIVITCIHCRADAGAKNGCEGGVCSNHDNRMLAQHDQPISDKQLSAGECKYPCNCTLKESCKFGVNMIKDGCDCCLMCARQQGDLCNYRDKCDDEKGLYCDLKLDAGMRGVCRARDAKPCVVQGKTYKDGEEFKPNCSQLCTCQDGRYACASLCPQELRPPSSAHCRDAQLVSIDGRCCREWVCPHTHSLVGPDDNFHNESPATEDSACKIETTHWSSCSVSCGMGVSIRMTGDADCQPQQQRRLCIVRPCNVEPPPPPAGSRRGCRNTWSYEDHRRIQIDKCESIDEYRLNYCSECNKRHRCCGPAETDTEPVEFKCSGQPDVVVKQMMMIVTCKCYRLKECPFL